MCVLGFLDCTHEVEEKKRGRFFFCGVRARGTVLSRLVFLGDSKLFGVLSPAPFTHSAAGAGPATATGGGAATTPPAGRTAQQPSPFL